MNKRTRSMGRRRSRSLAGFVSKDFCETIPKSSSPSERLLMLLERSFQYALSTAEKESMENENCDVSRIRTDSTNCWENLKPDIEGLCKLAVTEDTMTNLSFVNVKDAEDVKAKLEAESNEWTEQIHKYRKALAKEIDSPCTVNASEWKEKDMLYDYSDIVQYCSSSREKLQKQVEKLSASVISVTNSLKYNSHFKQITRSKCKKLFENEEQESAKSLILNAKCASVNRVTKRFRDS